jgi:superfamily II DNA/RNA helicase
VEAIASTCHDQALRDTIVFGVALHHGGMHPTDRSAVEELFSSGKIQVLVCTSTLACKQQWHHQSCDHSTHTYIHIFTLTLTPFAHSPFRTLHSHTHTHTLIHIHTLSYTYTHSHHRGSESSVSPGDHQRH